MKALILAPLALLLLTVFPAAASAGCSILGRWMTERNDLIVEIYLAGTEYKAKIVWVSGKEPENRMDDKNPDPALRSRKVIGMDVLQGFAASQTARCWENGRIYDATSGKTWSASARLDDLETLTVRGFWGFEIFGKTLRFKRYRPAPSS